MNDTTDTRRRILGGAQAALLAQGVRGLTVENAAAHSGLSKGAVLYHFPSKHDLVKALLEQALADCTTLLDNEGIAALDGDAGERLCWALMSTASQHPEVFPQVQAAFLTLYRHLPADDAIPSETRLLAQLARTFLRTFNLPLPNIS